MQPKLKKNLFWLVGLLLLLMIAVLMAFLVRSNFGSTQVTYHKIDNPDGYTTTARLYRPKVATETNPMPAVITINGWNNDKDTQGPSSIELSRRGFVVLAVDPYGHGESTGPFLGIASEKADGYQLQGVDHAYDWLIKQPFVDTTKIGITGHSMGAGLSREVARARPEIQAVVMQCSCGPVPDFDYQTLNNFLCIYAQWEEMSNVDGGRGDERYDDPDFYKGLGLAEPVIWNHNYGSFENNSAFQINLNRSTHPGMPPSHEMITHLVEWMRRSLKSDTYDVHWIPQGQHIYTYYDVFMGLAFIVAMATTIPLANLILKSRFFAPVATPMPSNYVAKKRDWWKLALTNAFIAMITYPIFTLLGIALSTFLLPSILQQPVPSGLAMWLLGNAIIFFFMFRKWYRKNHKENGVTLYDMGVSFDKNESRLNWRIIGKSTLLALILILWVYALVSLSQNVLGIEFRCEYGLLKAFALPQRFLQFLLWIIPALAIMLLNNGVFLFGMARQPEYETAFKTQIIWWLKNCLAVLGFLVLYLLFQYVPAWILNTNVGLDLLGLPSILFSAGAMFALSLFQIIPFFIVLLFFQTYFFRRTGKIYLGSIFLALVIAWGWAIGHQINIFP